MSGHERPLDRLRIVVLGYLVRGPMGGMAWHHLQYILGLTALGHEVFFLEDSDDYETCYDPSTGTTGTDPTYGLAFTRRTLEQLGLAIPWAYFDAHGKRWHGPASDSVLDSLASVDLLINVSGVNPMRPWFDGIPRRVLIDTDPTFTQIRHNTDPDRIRFAAQHNSFFTFGENIVDERHDIPPDGLPWQPTRQPVVLNQWPMTPYHRQGALTTIMQWESYSTRRYCGRDYGMKSESFLKIRDVPGRVGTQLEVALGANPNAPVGELRASGWTVRDAAEVTQDVFDYRRYIQQSKGEFGVAKHGYVVSRSGWFSERSANYLASGRPVIVEDTGFVDWMETGTGVIPFSTPDEAVSAIEDLDARYDQHCRVASSIAEEYFDSGKVLTDLIRRAMTT